MPRSGTFSESFLTPVGPVGDQPRSVEVTPLNQSLRSATQDPGPGLSTASRLLCPAPGQSHCLDVHPFSSWSVSHPWAQHLGLQRRLNTAHDGQANGGLMGGVEVGGQTVHTCV